MAELTGQVTALTSQTDNLSQQLQRVLKEREQLSQQHQRQMRIVQVRRKWCGFVALSSSTLITHPNPPPLRHLYVDITVAHRTIG